MANPSNADKASPKQKTFAEPQALQCPRLDFHVGDGVSVYSQIRIQSAGKSEIETGCLNFPNQSAEYKQDAPHVKISSPSLFQLNDPAYRKQL